MGILSLMVERMSMNCARTRNSNIELLRIMSIFSILFLHIYRHASGGGIFDSGFSLNHVFNILLSSWGLVGVFVFVIISSYFLIDSNQIKLSNLLNVILCTSTYSLLTLLFSRVYLGKQIIIKEIIKAVLAPALNSYWYITGYIVLYILHPVLNIVIKKLSTSELGKIVASSFALCFVYKFVYVTAPIETVSLFFSVYFGVALFKRVQGKIDYRIVYSVGWFSVFVVICFGLLHTLTKSGVIKYIYSQSISKFSPFMLAIAFALFCYCINKKPSYNRTINIISKAVLPVYLIHESDYIISILWDDIFKIDVLYSKPYFAVLFICIAILIFAICSVTDFAIRPIYSFASDKISNFIIYKMRKMKWEN